MLTHFRSYFETLHGISASHLEVFSFMGTAQEAGGRSGAAGILVHGPLMGRFS